MKLYIEADGRLGFNVPEAYSVNEIFSTTLKPIWYVANKVEEAVRRINDQEYLRSAIDCVESEADQIEEPLYQLYSKLTMLDLFGQVCHAYTVSANFDFCNPSPQPLI